MFAEDGVAVTVSFTVAGAIGLSRDGAVIEDRAFGGPQPRLVAAMLLVDRDRAWSAEQLAAQVWPAGRPERWRPAVRLLVSRLRGLLADLGVADDAIVSRAGHYHVDIPELVVDLEVAGRQVGQAADALADGRLDVADELAARARAVLSRPILPGLEAPWVEDLRRTVGPGHVESLLVLGRVRRGQGRWSAARSVVAEALGRAPFREDAWRDFMGIEADAGNVAAALQLYEDCRLQLADELGVDPSAATQRLHMAILRSVPTPPPAGDLPAPPDHALSAILDERQARPDGADHRAPYVGLRPFEQADAELYFGRDAAVQRLVDLLADHPAATVVGPSGSGKSSLVRAGLLPSLSSGAIPDADTWPLAVVVPGRRPLVALAAALVAMVGDADLVEPVDDLVDRLADDASALDALARQVLTTTGADPAAKILLVVDQAEEFFTVGDPDESAAVLAALAIAVRAHASRVCAVLTMRADFYPKAASNPDMAGLLGRSQLVIPPMSGAELEAAIVGPAALADVALERGIVGRMVAEASGQPGRLPLLQHTLWELWHHRDGSTLTLAGYERIGGLAGALARHAEQTWQSVDDPALARRILLRGVSPGRQGEVDSRRPVARRDLDGMAGAQDLDAVLESLVSSRLLQAQAREEGPVFELAHEALLSEWPRLRGWIEEDRAAIVAAEQVAGAAGSWESVDRDPGALFRGTRLAVALDQLDGRTDALPQIARQFLDASRAARDDRRERESERLARQERTNRRLRRQLVGLAAAMVVAVVGGLVALDQRRDAQAQQRVAVARELAAASTAVVDEDAELGVLLALEAVDTTRAVDGTVLPEAEGALHRAVTLSRIVVHVAGLGGSVAWSPDGRLFVTEGPEESGLVDLRDVRTGESVRDWIGHDADINDVGFSPDGSVLVTTGDDGRLRIWDPDTGQLQAEHAGEGQVWGVSFSPDGARVAAAWTNEDLVRVVDVASGELSLEVRASTAVLGDPASFSPDGERLAVADGAEVVVVDAATGDVVLGYQPTMDEVLAVSWSPDGEWIASGSRGVETRVTDAETGSVHIRLAEEAGDVFELTWSGETGHLATGARDGTVRVWAIGDDVAVEQVAVGTRDGAVGGIAFSPDGQQLVSGNLAVTSARVWEVGIAGGAEVVNLPTPEDGLRRVEFTPDGDGVVLTGDGAEAVVWDVPQGTRRSTLGPGQTGSFDIAVSPDGDLVATLSFDEPPRVQVWNPDSGDEVFTVHQDDFVPDYVAWSPGGERLAVAGVDPRGEPGSILVVDRTGELVTTLTEEADHRPADLAFAPDGVHLVAGRWTIGRQDPTVDGLRVWDWAQGDVVIDMAVFPSEIAVSPDGTRIATALIGGGGSIWDFATGDQLATLTGHTGDITALAFAPDGQVLATSGVDGTIRLWAADSGVEQLVLHSPDGPVSWVDFGPDGDVLATASAGVARVWALDVDDLIDIAEGRLTRSLTEPECLQYLHAAACSS